MTGSRLIQDLRLDMETSEHKPSDGSDLGKALKSCLQRGGVNHCCFEATHALYLAKRHLMTFTWEMVGRHPPSRKLPLYP